MPIVYFQITFYAMLMISRLVLIIYTVWAKCARYMLILALTVLFPFFGICAVFVTYFLMDILANDANCYDVGFDSQKEAGQGWTIFLCISLSSFLFYNYCLLMCGACYRSFNNSRRGKIMNHLF
jgi:hypothetical protein